MGNGNSSSDHDKNVAFKAEVKLDLKYIREGINENKTGIAEITKKVNKQCTEIAVLKTKVVIYAGIATAIVSLAVSIMVSLIKG